MKILIELEDDSPEGLALDALAAEQDRSRTAQARKMLREALLETTAVLDTVNPEGSN